MFVEETYRPPTLRSGKKNKQKPKGNAPAGVEPLGARRRVEAAVCRVMLTCQVCAGRLSTLQLLSTAIGTRFVSSAVRPGMFPIGIVDPIAKVSPDLDAIARTLGFELPTN